MVEEVAPQAEHHALAEAGEPADQHRLEQPADCGDAKVDHDDYRQVVLVAGADALVDRIPDEQPAAGLRGRVPRADEQEHRRPKLPSFEVTTEAPHAAITSSP